VAKHDDFDNLLSPAPYSDEAREIERIREWQASEFGTQKTSLAEAELGTLPQHP